MYFYLTDICINIQKHFIAAHTNGDGLEKGNILWDGNIFQITYKVIANYPLRW